MIEQLQIHQLRNLQAVNLTLKRCNLFVGDNASGKTSLLEAVFLLSRGKSFRHHEPKRYISHYQNSCTVWATTPYHTLALQKQLDAKNFATSLLKLDGQVVPTQSALSLALPVLLIDPSGMAMLEEGSGGRRQLLDWLAFHVEPRFYGVWLAYQRLLRQRNALLKATNMHFGELMAWDKQLAYHAKHLHDYRHTVFASWVQSFEMMIAKLLPAYAGQIKLSYQAGFDEKLGLFASLQQRLASDKELGHTRIGAHRADVLVVLSKTNQSGNKLKEQAANILSRGEKKLLITALRLSQLQTVCQNQSHAIPVVLIDDIDAELDDKAVDVFLQTALSLPCQLLITSLNPDMDALIQQKIADKMDYQRFLVKAGNIVPS